MEVSQVEVGKIIKTCRTEKNLTQEELANILFVSRQLISKWENGKSYPDLNQLIQLSDYFDVSLDELMRGDQEMIKKKDTQVKTVEKGKRIIIILVGIAIFVALYFGILKIQINHLYRNVKNENWEDEGFSFVQRVDGAQYNVFKIPNYNIFNFPKNLPITATPINSRGERAFIDKVMLQFDGNKEKFYINWMDGDLVGQTLHLDSEFKYKKELQPIEEQTISYEFEKIFNKELDIERPFLEPFLNEVDEKWQEVNKK